MRSWVRSIRSFARRKLKMNVNRDGPRFLPNTLSPTDFHALDENAQAAVCSTLERAIEDAIEFIEVEHPKCKAEEPGSSMIYGSTGGIAWAYMRLVLQSSALNLRTDLQTRIASLLVAHANTCLPPSPPSPRSGLNCGQIGFLIHPTGGATLALLLHYSLGGLRPMSDTELSHCIEILRTMSAAFNIPAAAGTSGEEEGFDAEPLNGRAGLLHAFLLLRKNVPLEKMDPTLRELVDDALIGEMVRVIVESGRVGAKVQPEGMRMKMPLVWRWTARPEVVLLSAGHGIAGILLTVLQAPPSAWKPYIEEILETVDCLVDLQMENGNWSVGVGHPKNDLVHWCHGAPGFILLLSHILSSSLPLDLSPTRRDKYTISLSKAVAHTWERGILTKGPGICHGITGSAYALLHSGEKDRALEMALCATEWRALEKDGKIRRPDGPSSLFEGLAGAVCMWADTLCVLKGHEEQVIGFPASLDVGTALAHL
ncbi:hypothetical protein EXIGLDRAFT_833897 [Exidia glandulosa HHB12029]|uniref:Lanthionine synthetase C family protein n=1 Tax=Exidia glandulosa HHB12029 TaxID=1314781 RepID=A0A165KCB9_EXIGL|nr:hypothetical protein EXIGLDRAFT_833897 [Exidia glandulosa HHB12029]